MSKPAEGGLLERDDVLSQLNDALRSAANGVGRLVLLSGEAGVGKTSVIQGFVSGLSGRERVLIGSCDPLTTPRPLGPLVDVAGHMGPLLKKALDQTLAGAEVHGLFGSVLADLNAPGRMSILVIEDAHWADEATLDLLRFLAYRTEHVPVLILVS